MAKDSHLCFYVKDRTSSKDIKTFFLFSESALVAHLGFALLSMKTFKIEINKVKYISIEKNTKSTEGRSLSTLYPGYVGSADMLATQLTELS